MNNDELLEKLAKLLNYDLDRVFTLTNTDGKYHLYRTIYSPTLPGGILREVNNLYEVVESMQT